MFMIELEKAVLLELTEFIKYWKMYVDDTISFVKLGTINYIITKLNSFDKKIPFTFKEEHKGTLPFLDLLFQRNGNSTVTTIFRKPTNNDIYLNWNAFPPDISKRGTLKTLAKGAYIVCSTNELLQKEFKYLVKVFHETNNYPHYVIKQILKQVHDEQKEQKVNVPTAAIADEANANRKKEQLLLVPYQDKKRDYVIKSMKKRMKCLLPTNIVIKTAYAGSKLSTCFRVKDVTKFKHNHDIIDQGRCPEIGCNDHYLGETDCRISERVLDHAARDQNSHHFKHSIESGHPVLEMNNYKTIEEGYKNNVRKRKIGKALLIKEMKPTLNKPDNSVELQLFN